MTSARADPPIVPATHLRDVAVDLYWLPLGAGGHFVRLNGAVYEALAARLAHRAACDLYHSALEVQLPARRYVIEMAPIFQAPPEQRGVVAIGPVGARWAGRSRWFQYGIRRWLDGVIPDVAEAVDSPVRLTPDAGCAQRLLDLVPQVPTPVWGRDELGTGDMWNSNSLIAWLIARSGIDVEAIPLPAGGRAPGWTAGVVVARRQQAQVAGTSAERTRRAQRASA
ncbi:MAG: hypothetical protein ACXVRP_04125 [Solirubrobacteraceae bacterium]